MNEAYIDGQNLRFGTKKAANPWEIDLSRFRVYLSSKYNVNRAYYYIGAYTDDHIKLYEHIVESGFIPRYREHTKYSSSKKKGNVDTDIVFDIMKKIAEKDEFDKVILVSGDGDYFRMVEYLIENNKFLRLLAPDSKRMSRLYRRLSSQYYDYLNSEDIKRKIAK